jgi:hypothetical protein
MRDAGLRASPFCRKERAMRKRQRFKQTRSLQERLSEFIATAREDADGTPGGADQYELLKKIRKAETAANMEAWEILPELHPPK